MELCNYLDELDIDRLSICSVPVHKKGPVYSVEQYQHHIEDDEQVIINYCDFSRDWDYYEFEEFVNYTNKKLVTIACGANMNFERLRFVAERAELGEEKEAMVAVGIPEKAGSLKLLCIHYIYFLIL